MAAQTFSPHAVALEASKAMGRPVTDKQVRATARATMARFDKVKHPERLVHVYSAAERTALVASIAKRAGVTLRKPRTAKPKTASVPDAS
jgi:hypothetical protein